MKKTPALLGSLAVVALLFGGCLILKLTPESFQSLVLHFRLTQAISAGQNSDVYVAGYLHEVVMKRKWAKVSGKLVAPDGGDLPNRVVVQAVAKLAETGVTLFKIKLTVDIEADGTFVAVKKIKKNIPPGTMQTIQVQPLGNALQAGTQVWLCVDVFQTKKHARSSSDCGADSSPPDGGSAKIVDVLDNQFDPMSLTIEAGDTVRWVLAGSNLNHTSTALAGTWDSGLVFNEPGAFFERTFPQSEDGMTFEYYCLNHQGCCQMQGSIRVGENAPDPDTGY